MRVEDLSIVFRNLVAAFGVFSLNILLKQLKALTRLCNPVVTQFLLTQPPRRAPL